MTYRLALSLEKLRSQVNVMAPNRSKVSDGWIGDASHFATGSASDHNPWVKQGSMGIVTAIDITHDPRNGVDVLAIANAIVKSRDRRMKYMIYTGGAGGNPGIISATVSPWAWRTRRNDDHPHHLHVSVNSNAADYDSTSPWSIGSIVQPPNPPPGRGGPDRPPPPMSTKLVVDGVFGLSTRRRLQQWAGVTQDGDLGPQSWRAIQRKVGAVVDGVAGPNTWRRLQAKVGAPQDGTPGPITYRAIQRYLNSH